MGKTFRGSLRGDGLHIGIVVGRFNEFISKELLAGALDTLTQLGVAEGDVDVAWVPGSFEIPVVAKHMACCGRYDAVICLGAVIRGATAHFDMVAGQATAGIARVGVDTGVPIVFGVLTTDTIEQAIERAGTKAGNKGRDAAQTAVETATLLSQLRGDG